MCGSGGVGRHRTPAPAPRQLAGAGVSLKVRYTQPTLVRDETKFLPGHHFAKATQCAEV